MADIAKTLLSVLGLMKEPLWQEHLVSIDCYTSKPLFEMAFGPLSILDAFFVILRPYNMC